MPEAELPRTQTPDDEERSSRDVASATSSKVMLALAGIVALACGMVLFRIGAKSLWLDEGYSFAFARPGWDPLLSTITESQANMSLYYVLLRPWLAIGKSEGALRLLSGLFTVATVPVLYLLGRRLFSEMAGLVAALFFTFNAFTIHYAQEVRGYSLAALLVALATLIFLKAISDESGKRWWLIYVVVTAAAFYAHFFTGFVVAAHLGTLLVHRRNEFVKALPFYGAIALLISPLVWFIVTNSRNQIGWIPEPALGDLGRSFKALAGEGGVVLLALHLIGVVVLALRWKQRRDLGTTLLVLWLILPIGLSFMVSLVKPLFLDRYMIVSLPALMLTSAGGLASLRWKAVTVVVAGLIVLAAIGPLHDWYYDYRKDDWRAAAKLVTEQGNPSEGIVFVPPKIRKVFEYYVFEKDRVGDSPEPLYPGSEWGTYPANAGSSIADIREATADTPVIWIVRSRGSRALRESVLRALAEGREVVIHRKLRAVEIILLR